LSFFLLCWLFLVFCIWKFKLTLDQVCWYSKNNCLGFWLRLHYSVFSFFLFFFFL
jgi:hypothetical protein